MAQEYIEIREKTLEDAITTACQKLTVTSDRLDYIVVEEGRAGFLGVGARDAVIRARVKEAADAFSAEAKNISDVLTKDETFASPQKEAELFGEAAAEKEKEQPAEARAAKKPEKKEKKEKKDRPAKDEKRPRREKTEKAVRPDETQEGKAPAEKKPSRKHEEKPLTPEEISKVKEEADTFLTQVFQAMGMDVSINLNFDETENVLNASFDGDDMGVLIGKRGQTLDSLQYLVSLVINRDLDSYVHVKADTEDYRERRKKTLENLAKNISMRVKRTRHAVTLEPMNPYERRIIHSALQGDRYVTTYSEGEEPFRRVVVTPKK